MDWYLSKAVNFFVRRISFKNGGLLWALDLGRALK